MNTIAEKHYNLKTEKSVPVCTGRQAMGSTSINTRAVENPEFITKVSGIYGSSTIVVSIDVRRNIWGKYSIFTNRGENNTGIDPFEFAENVEEMGAGEILLTSINNEGTMKGYDLDLLIGVTEKVNIPVIVIGGAGNIEDFNKAISIGGASAVSAGSMFVYYGKHRAVLINYPCQEEIRKINRGD